MLNFLRVFTTKKIMSLPPTTIRQKQPPPNFPNFQIITPSFFITELLSFPPAMEGNPGWVHFLIFSRKNSYRSRRENEGLPPPYHHLPSLYCRVFPVFKLRLRRCEFFILIIRFVGMEGRAWCVCVISWRRRAGICGMASLPSPSPRLSLINSFNPPSKRRRRNRGGKLYFSIL